MRNQSTMSLEENITIVDGLRPEAMALTADEVVEPDIPVMVMLDELNNTVLAVAQHMAALSAVGVTDEMATQLDRYSKGLRAAQAVWIAEKSRGRGEDHVAQLEEAEALREDLLAAGTLALRNDIAGQRRLSEIREGDSLPDLVDDLNNLAVLLTDKRESFEAIHMDVDNSALQADQLSSALQQMLSTEDVAKSLSDGKETRDRIYVLAKDTLKEIRLFASFAFRKDKSNNRRQIFTSAYMRRRNRKHRSNAAAASNGNSNI